MMINAISNDVNFQSKKYLPYNTTDKMRQLLMQMGQQSTHLEQGATFQSSMLKELNVNQYGTFRDLRNLMQPASTVKPGKARINIDRDKLELEVDVETGEITKLKKPLGFSLDSIIQRVDNFLYYTMHNINNQSQVHKHFSAHRIQNAEGAKRTMGIA